MQFAQASNMRHGGWTVKFNEIYAARSKEAWESKETIRDIVCLRKIPREKLLFVEPCG